MRYEGDLPDYWGALTAAEMAARFWSAAALGVYAGHSETLLRPSVASADAQPLWWAKGGTLVGGSPRRIRWMRRVWDAALCARALGDLRPTREAFGQPGGQVASMLSDDDASFHFISALRVGAWRVPLRQPAAAGSRRQWRRVAIDYWAMTLNNTTLPFNASSATVECYALPCNVLLQLTG